MRHLRAALLLVLAVGLALGAAAAPAGAGTSRTLTIATEDVTDNGWNGVYVQRYVIDVAGNGKFTGAGSYLGFVATDDPESAGAGVACGLTQTIKGTVGAKAAFVARYNAPESAYWYDFAGRIDGTNVSGTGKNVNGQRFVIRTATAAEITAATNSCSN